MCSYINNCKGFRRCTAAAGRSAPEGPAGHTCGRPPERSPVPELPQDLPGLPYTHQAVQSGDDCQLIGRDSYSEYSLFPFKPLLLPGSSCHTMRCSCPCNTSGIGLQVDNLFHAVVAARVELAGDCRWTTCLMKSSLPGRRCAMPQSGQTVMISRLEHPY